MGSSRPHWGLLRGDMQELIVNGRAIEFWVTLAVGVFTMYIGFRVQRRRKWPEKIKLKPAEILIGLFLVGADGFFIAVAHLK